MRKTFFALTFFIVLLSLTGKAQMEPQRVHWTFEAGKTAQNEVILQFYASPDEHWHLYGINDEMYPLFFGFDSASAYSYDGTIIEVPESKAKYDELMEANRAQFDGKALFIQKIKLTSDTATVTGFLDYQTCIEAEDGRCLLEKQDFKFNLDLANLAVIDLNKLIEDKTAEYGSPTHSENTEEVTEVIVEGGDVQENLGNEPLWHIFLIAFGAGLLAIFTPCVLPMVPMTVTFFMKSSENKAKGRKQALMYGFSILFIFTILGSLLSFIFGPQFFQWLSTHWIPNIIFFLIFVVFAAAFFGMFELRMPNKLINKSDAQADKGGFLGPFFMAFTLVLVSFSCTVPIIGAVVVMLSQGNFLHPIVAMFGFGLAFALPFTLFALFPRWLGALPKSGGWMNTLKVILGFVELALGLKFLSVADMTYHWGLLDREIYLAFWIVIFSIMGVYLLGKIKFAHDSDTPYLKVPRLIMAILTFTFVVYLIPGMFGAPLKALSGWIPPMATHDFNLLSPSSNSHSGNTMNGTDIYSEAGMPKFSDVIHSPHGIQGYYDYEQGLAAAKKLKRPVFIDFSGHGCVNCRKMEEQVWNEPQVLKRLINDYIVIQLYTDDRTSLDEVDWTPAEESHDGKVKKTLGDKWASMQIKRFKRNSQPQYVLLDFNGEMLVSETRGFNLNVEEYVNFLDEGIKEFKKRNP